LVAACLGGLIVTLHIQPHLFAALRTGFEAVPFHDAPIGSELINRVRVALTKARATALPGLPVLVTLGSAGELSALSACFKVGGELRPDVTDDQWDSIVALVATAPLRDAADRRRESSVAASDPQTMITVGVTNRRTRHQFHERRRLERTRRQRSTEVARHGPSRTRSMSATLSR
jgi:hypothetical protein